MKRYINYILLILVLFLLLSCTTKELAIGYSTTCFNKFNKVVYIKTHQYFHWDLTQFMSADVYDRCKYICKMDLYGNEEVIDIVPENISVYHFSCAGNGRICIQTGGYSAYTYIDGKFKEVLSGRIYAAQISHNGEKIVYEKFENDTYSLCVSDINGMNVTKYGFGTPEHWVPNNTEVVANDRGTYYLLDITTSNTTPLPYAYKWSHDMQKIAYFDGDIKRLIIMDADETNKVITDWEHGVIWSYDGEYLLSGFHLLDKNGNLIRTLREKE